MKEVSRVTWSLETPICSLTISITRSSTDTGEPPRLHFSVVRSRHHDHEPLEPLRFKQDAGVVTVPGNWIKTVLESNQDGTRLATGCRQTPRRPSGNLRLANRSSWLD